MTWPASVLGLRLLNVAWSFGRTLVGSAAVVCRTTTRDWPAGTAVRSSGKVLSVDVPVGVRRATSDLWDPAARSLPG